MVVRDHDLLHQVAQVVAGHGYGAIAYTLIDSDGTKLNQSTSSHPSLSHGESALVTVYFGRHEDRVNTVKLFLE